MGLLPKRIAASESALEAFNAFRDYPLSWGDNDAIGDTDAIGDDNATGDDNEQREPLQMIQQQEV